MYTKWYFINSGIYLYKCNYTFNFYVKMCKNIIENFYIYYVGNTKTEIHHVLNFLFIIFLYFVNVLN